MTTTMPIVQRMAIPATKPITRRRMPRIIMRRSYQLLDMAGRDSAG